MTGPPRVSVLMNCYNGEKYLREAIESVLAQTYADWELVFWDNRSTDQSATIFKSYPDPRLRYILAPEHTLLYEARALALPHLAGDFVGFLDVDDTWAPDKLEKQVPLFDDPNVGIVCGNYWIESERKRKRWLAIKGAVPASRALDALLENYFVGLLTLMVRRSAVMSLPRTFSKDYNIIGDFDLVIRLAAEQDLAYVGEPVAHYRLHGTSESAKGRGRHIDELIHWQSSMQDSEIAKSPAFDCVRQATVYLSALHALLQGDRRAAVSRFNELPWGHRKTKLLAALLMPRALVRQLKN